MAPDVEAQELVSDVVLARGGKDKLYGRANVGGGINQRAIDIE